MGRLLKPNGLPEPEGMHYSAHIGEELTFDMNTTESQRIATRALSILYRATTEGQEASNTFGFIASCQEDCGQSSDFYCDMLHCFRDLELIVLNGDGDIELTAEGLQRAEGNYLDQIVTGGFILTLAEERLLSPFAGVMDALYGRAAKRYFPPPLELDEGDGAEAY